MRSLLTIIILVMFNNAAVAQENAPAQNSQTPASAPTSTVDQYTERAQELIATATETLNERAKDEHSPVGMFMDADVVVQSVMILLIVASVVSWLIVVAKFMSIRYGKSSLKRSYRKLEKLGYTDANAHFSKGRGVVGRMFRAAVQEREKTGEGANLKGGIKERVSSQLSRIEIGAARKMTSGTSVLANIGSTAPFIGLFGTVWGIMNSFISIAETNTTNLSVVAPGIAEALLATGLGLVAAIPAVIFYNLLARAIGGYKIMLGDAGALVERSLSRDLDLSNQLAHVENTLPSKIDESASEPLISAAAE